MLWYVSGGPFDGVQSIRACSQIIECLVDSPKAIKSRYYHNGVYEWRRILNSAGGDLCGRVMAFRFSGVEAFARPLGYDAYKEYTQRGAAPAGPLPIDAAIFARIYNECTEFLSKNALS